MHIYIYTYLHIYIYTYIHIHIYTYIHIYIYTYAYTCFGVRSFAPVYTHTCIHTYIYTHIHMTRSCLCTEVQVFFFLLPEGTVTFRSALTWALHVYTCTRMYTHTCMHIRIYAYTSALPYHGFINIYVHTLTYMHINVYPHTYTHVYVYTHTYMDIRIYVYTYIQLYFQRGRSAVPYHGLLDRMPL